MKTKRRFLIGEKVGPYYVYSHNSVLDEYFVKKNGNDALLRATGKYLEYIEQIHESSNLNDYAKRETKAMSFTDWAKTEKPGVYKADIDAAINYLQTSSHTPPPQSWVISPEVFKSLYINSNQSDYQTPPPTPTTMNSLLRRLTTSGDWTIALDDATNKFVAFDQHGQQIVAVGSLLSADGKAWMYKNGKLWSGVLEQVLTERQIIQQEEEKRIQKKAAICSKYNAKIQQLEQKKQAALENVE